jgi:hypothetical protein
MIAITTNNSINVKPRLKIKGWGAAEWNAEAGFSPSQRLLIKTGRSLLIITS